MTTLIANFSYKKGEKTMYYKFMFMKKGGQMVKNIYANSEDQAWNKADEWASENGYLDAVMVGL